MPFPICSICIKIQRRTVSVAAAQQLDVPGENNFQLQPVVFEVLKFVMGQREAVEFPLTGQAATPSFPETGDLASLSDEEPQLLFQVSWTGYDLEESIKLKLYFGLLKAKLAFPF